MNRLNRQLKIHFGEDGELLCTPHTSRNYLFAHLSTKLEDVTCEKCLEEKARARKAYVEWLGKSS